MSYKVDIVTIFPEMFEPFKQKGLVGQAIQSGKIELLTLNPREFTTDIHKTVDDRPYGGGDGMVMLAEPLSKAVEKVNSAKDRPVIYLSPQGEKLTDAKARELSDLKGMVLICGRYGGVDERFIATHVDHELSVGDYVLNGGEVAAMCVVEAVSRFVPGVLGNQQSAEKDSFRQGLLEAPLMTRPQEYQGLKVPTVLTSGDHKAIERWRYLLGILRTHFRRPELLSQTKVSSEDFAAAMNLYNSLSNPERVACGLPHQD